MCYVRINFIFGVSRIYIAGVIDRDYRGNVGVVLFNLSKEDYLVKRGDRVAQLVLERVLTPPVVELDVCYSRELQEKGRG